MAWSASEIELMATRMAARPRGFRVSAKTAPLVVAALKAYAQAEALAQLDPFVVETLGASGERTELLAQIASHALACAAFEAAVRQQPTRRFVLRRRNKVFESYEPPPAERAV